MSVCQASMLSTPDGPFINLARLDMSKYATKPTLAKALFEYIFHHENDIRNVMLSFSLDCVVACCVSLKPVFNDVIAMFEQLD